ncbi:hypothetical protein ABFG93_14640 [Pseudalkalibacillus hwajinpoensis]|uniref:SGNH/GDSL hydrolase family protein n=1 Tax=Guptibacillus hwajinpoensis TaxID=208199 RepID=UPI00325BBDB1
MKNIIFLLAFIGCFALVIAGKFHWDDKNEQSGLAVSAEVESGSLAEENSVKEKPISDEKLKKLVANFPEQLHEKMMSSNEPVSLVIMGSEMIGTKEAGLESIVEEGLEEAYWKGAFKVEQITFEEATTSTVVQEELYKEVIQQKPDVVLMETFTLNDNGNVVIEESHQNLSTIITELKEAIPGISVMVMPSNPISDPDYYSLQINKLGDYAENKDFIYLDHWEAWPDVNDEVIKKYLSDSKPNEKGFNVWGDFIVNYMSGK